MFFLFYLKLIIISFVSDFRTKKFQYFWKKNNMHNYTFPTSTFNHTAVSCGKMTYGKLNVVSFNNLNEKLYIGNYCSISDNVVFLLGGEHHPKYISNYPFYLNVLKSDKKFQDNTTRGPIFIEDDVWIGRDSLILSGVKIGQGAIIAAGSVVTKNVPPYAIYSTNRIIKYRFSPAIIDQLLLIDYNTLTEPKITKFLELLYSDVDENLIDSEQFKMFIDSKE